jgi:hypothetical protein
MSRPGNSVNAVCFLAATVFLLWAMRSGALAMWDRHSPVKDGPIVPWLLAIPVAIIGGGLLMPLLSFQVSALVDWWRDRDRDS